MAKKSKPKTTSWMDVWKGTRKDPIPPKRVDRDRSRDLQDEVAQDDIDDALYERYEDE